MICQGAVGAGLRAGEALRVRQALHPRLDSMAVVLRNMCPRLSPNIFNSAPGVTWAEKGGQKRERWHGGAVPLTTTQGRTRRSSPPPPLCTYPPAPQSAEDRVRRHPGPAADTYGAGSLTGANALVCRLRTPGARRYLRGFCEDGAELLPDGTVHSRPPGLPTLCGRAPSCT